MQYSLLEIAIFAESASRRERDRLAATLQATRVATHGEPEQIKEVLRELE